MWSKIKRWFWRKGIIKCKHEWIPAREFYKGYNGQDYEYLEPTPMRHHPDWQANAYVCRKCHETRVAVEKRKIGGFTDDLRV